MNREKDNIFLVKLSETEGYLSPLFFQYKTKHIAHAKKLKDVAIVNETRNRPRFEADKLVPYVGLPDTDEITHSIVNVVHRPYSEVKGRNIIFKNELLFARIEPSIFNKKYILTDQLGGNDFAFTSTEFYTINGTDVSNNYLLICLLSDYVYNQVKGKTTGSTGRRRLDPAVFKNIRIPVPSVEVRQKVESIFSDAFEKREKKKEKAQLLLSKIDEFVLKQLGIKLPVKDNSIRNRIFITSNRKLSGNRFDPKVYDNYSQALFLAIEQSKYPLQPLKSLIIRSCSGNWGLDEYFIDEEYEKCLVIRSTEFDNDFNLDLSNNRLKFRQINKQKLRQLDVQQDDLLIEKSGGSPIQPVGRIAILTDEILNIDQICFSNFIHKIRIDKSKILPMYLFTFLKTIHNIKITDLMQSQTSGIRNLIMGEYFNQSIVIPESLAAQEEITENANAMRFQAKALIEEANQEYNEQLKKIENIILEG